MNILNAVVLTAIGRKKVHKATDAEWFTPHTYYGTARSESVVHDGGQFGEHSPLTHLLDGLQGTELVVLAGLFHLFVLVLCTTMCNQIPVNTDAANSIALFSPNLSSVT